MRGTFVEEEEEEDDDGGGGADDIVAFARERLGFKADPIQAELLRSPAKRGILNCSRQWGKSTVAAVKAIHRAFTVDGSLVIVATPTARQSGEFLEKVRELMAFDPDLKPVRGDGHNRLSLRFPNGSRIVGLPGKHGTVRGFSRVSLMLIDETAWVPDTLYKALRPMLAVGNGDLWLMSTPMGKRGFFYDAWQFGGERWTRFRVPVTECADRIGVEFLEDERASVGGAWFRQEYLCEFVDQGGEVFDRVLVEQAVEGGVVGLGL